MLSSEKPNEVYVQRCSASSCSKHTLLCTPSLGDSKWLPHTNIFAAIQETCDNLNENSDISVSSI